MVKASIVDRLKRKWKHLWIKPIRVFCFHQVSDKFEPDTMWEPDWIQTESFKKKILKLKTEYTFLPLQEAYRHIANDTIRFKKYASLTADDGWASLKNIIPWLAEQQIPVTLFLNPCYLDGKHYQSRPTEKLLTREEVSDLVETYAPLITIASHGWIHADGLKMTDKEFEESVLEAEKDLQKMTGKAPFYAFTYGHYKQGQIQFLKTLSLIPVLMDGRMNDNDKQCVHREGLDGV